MSAAQCQAERDALKHAIANRDAYQQSE